SIRWDPAAVRACGYASHLEAIVAGPDADAQCPEAFRHGFDAVRLLQAELAGPGHPAVPAREPCRQCEERQLVDEARYLLFPHVRGGQLRRVHLEVTDGLAADLAAIEDADARTHAFQHVQQAGAPWVETHVMDRQLR